jgi:hypothetical protein
LKYFKYSPFARINDNVARLNTADILLKYYTNLEVFVALKL